MTLINCHLEYGARMCSANSHLRIRTTCGALVVDDELCRRCPTIEFQQLLLYRHIAYEVPRLPRRYPLPHSHHSCG